MKLLAFLFVVVAALAVADAYPGAPLWAPAVAVPTTVVKTVQPALLAPAPAVVVKQPILTTGWAGKGWAGNGWAGNGWAGNGWAGNTWAGGKIWG